VLRPIDILLVLKIQASGRQPFAVLGRSLGISASQAHAAARRAILSDLLREDLTVRQKALLNTLLAIKYYVPAVRGGLVRGIPTAYAAPPLSSQIQRSDEPIPVWPHAEGSERGLSCEPIYRTASQAALDDPLLYDYLALIDTLRIGRAREVAIANSELAKRLVGSE
jgi:DNA-binding Lrp family transcriptional regulator